MDVVKNYHQYGYDDSLRNAAIDILRGRGITQEDLKLLGNFENQQFNSALEIAKSFSSNSNFAFLFFTIFLIAKFLTPLLGSNSETPGWVFLITSALSA